MRLIVTLLVFLSLSCSHAPVGTSIPVERQVSAENSSLAINYPEIFLKVREALKPPPGTKRSSKVPAESDIVAALQRDQSLMQSSQQQLLAVVKTESSETTDLTKHLRLVPPAGQPGYSDLKYFANHPYVKGFMNNAKSSNLIEVWRSFILSAKKELVLNIFDFDLKIIADALVDRVRAGVKVNIGIDKNTIAARPEVKSIYDFLVANGVTVTAVNPVSLNHQKMAAIDWNNVDDARVLFSSGNLTQSCLGPEGDLVNLPPNKRPKESIPNANHVITMKSWLLSNLVNHELTKTLDSNFLYRGTGFPTTGSYQVTGPGVDPMTLEAYPENSLIITFSPGGGLRNINKNVIGHFIRNSEGPVRMAQFAYSSEEVAKALFERAQASYQKKKNFDFKAVGDTPFAMQFWSQFLKMSGLDVVVSEKGKSYQTLSSNTWFSSLSKTNMNKMRGGIHIAPNVYGDHYFNIDGVSYKTTSKIHHKILTAGPYAIVGTSFNFSEAAENNDEQILVFKDKNLVKFVDGMTAWLISKSERTVYQEALRRNKKGELVKEQDSNSVE